MGVENVTFTLLVCSNRFSGDFRRLLESISREDLSERDALRIVDNGMGEGARAMLSTELSQLNLRADILDEPRPGLGFARSTGFSGILTDWVILLDEDNELGQGFLNSLRSHTADESEVGGICPCVQARWNSRVPRWVEDYGRRFCLSVTESGEFSPEFEASVWASAIPAKIRPPGGGMIVRREVVEAFNRDYSRDASLLALARTSGSLGGCEDAVIYSCVARLGYASAYFPDILVLHHIPPSRAEWRYLVRITWDTLLSYGAYHQMVYSRGSWLKTGKLWLRFCLSRLFSPPIGIQPFLLNVIACASYGISLFRARSAHRVS